MIKNFIIVAQEARTEKAPTRRLTANIGTQEAPIYKDVGVAWVKKNARGETFLSAQLNAEERTYKNKEGFDVTVPAYVIIDQKEYEHLKACEERVKFLTSPTEEFPNGIDMAKHPLNSESQQKEYDNHLSEIGF